jgi:hypothetical protein
MTIDERIEGLAEWVRGDPLYRMRLEVLLEAVRDVCVGVLLEERDRAALVAKRYYEDPVWSNEFRFAANTIASAIMRGLPPAPPRASRSKK